MARLLGLLVFALKALRFLFCGGRDFADLWLVRRVFSKLVSKHGSFVVVHGAARGADSLCAEVAKEYGLVIEAYPADWNTHKKAAGPIRNQQMLDTGIDGCVAFPGGNGTADMVRRCRKAGVLIWEVKEP